MKKKAVALALLLTFSMLTGCGKDTQKDTTGTEPGTETVTETTTVTEEGTAETETAPVEAVYLKDVAVEQYISLSDEYKGMALSYEKRAGRI